MSRRAKRNALAAHGSRSAVESEPPAKAVKDEVTEIEPVASLPPVANTASAAEAHAVLCVTCGQDASRRCGACGLVLCKAHARTHEDEVGHDCAPLQHPVSSLPPPPLPRLGPLRCETHNRPLEYYCGGTCDVLLCDLCIDAHQRDRVTWLHIIRSVAVNCTQLHKSVAEAEAKVSALLGRRAEAAALLTEVTLNLQAVAAEVDAATERLHRAVDERQASLKRELAAFRAAEEARLAEEVQRAEADAGALEAAARASAAALADTDPQQVLRLPLGSELQLKLGQARDELKLRLHASKIVFVTTDKTASTIPSLIALQVTPAVPHHEEVLAARVSSIIPTFADQSELLLSTVRRSSGVEVHSVKALFKWLVEEAKRGCRTAHCGVAHCYSLAVGVPRNIAKAMASLRKGAELGDAEAQWYLGRRYKSGSGVQQSHEEAVRCFAEAARQGHESAQISLGNCYFSGEGVPMDPTMAVAWYQRAVEQGSASAAHDLAQRYENGNGVARDEARAMELFRRAADYGDVFAIYHLGECYENGLNGVQKEKDTAVKWYTLAALERHSSAKSALARLQGE